MKLLKKKTENLTLRDALDNFENREKIFVYVNDKRINLLSSRAHNSCKDCYNYGMKSFTFDNWNTCNKMTLQEWITRLEGLSGDFYMYNDVQELAQAIITNGWR